MFATNWPVVLDDKLVWNSKGNWKLKYLEKTCPSATAPS
jgi:hypothetical protein